MSLSFFMAYLGQKKFLIVLLSKQTIEIIYMMSERHQLISFKKYKMPHSYPVPQSSLRIVVSYTGLGASLGKICSFIGAHGIFQGKAHISHALSASEPSGFLM